VVIKRTPKGIPIQPGRGNDFLADFKEAITPEPERTGETENWPLKKMKDIWSS